MSFCFINLKLCFYLFIKCLGTLLQGVLLSKNRILVFIKKGKCSQNIVVDWWVENCVKTLGKYLVVLLPSNIQQCLSLCPPLTSPFATPIMFPRNFCFAFVNFQLFFVLLFNFFFFFLDFFFFFFFFFYRPYFQSSFSDVLLFAHVAYVFCYFPEFDYLR